MNDKPRSNKPRAEVADAGLSSVTFVRSWHRPWPDSDGPWELSVQFAESASTGIRVTGLALIPLSGKPRGQITSRTLQALSLPTLAQEYGRARVETLNRSGHHMSAEIAAMGVAATKRELSLGHYDQVAAVYRGALATGRPPTKAVATHFGIPASRAATWVRRARKYGRLEPSLGRGAAGLKQEDEA